MVVPIDVFPDTFRDEINYSLGKAGYLGLSHGRVPDAGTSGEIMRALPGNSLKSPVLNPMSVQCKFYPARYRTYIQERTQTDEGAKQLVSSLARPQPAEIREHLYLR